LKKHLISAAALSGLLAFTGAASAADAFVDPGYDWSGAYVGATLGYGFGDSEFDFAPAAGLNQGDYNIDGFLGGGQIGYNFQMDQFVFGPEVSYWGSDVSGTGPDVFPNQEGKTDVNWLAMFNARLGISHERWLGYVTGGYALGEVDYALIVGGATFLESSKSHDGWNIGVGVEHALTDNFIVGVEYRFIDLGNETHSDPLGDHNIDAEIHSAMLRASWKF
jgi:outer membrane immunogenic protein